MNSLKCYRRQFLSWFYEVCVYMCKTRKGEQQQTFGIDKWETNCHAKKRFTSSLQCMSQTRKAITKYICSNMFFPEPWALIYTVVVVIGLETFQKKFANRAT